MKKLILLCAATLIVSCSTKTEDLKSPCVSNEGGPCGPRLPINNRLG